MVGVMSETAKISGQSLVPTDPRPRAYREVRQVEIRAAVSRPSDTPEQKQAMARLDRFLDAGGSPRKDVPRGFYINIRV